MSMLGQSEPTYVQNGLVLHLDALDPGSADGSTWVDKVSGHIFTNHGATLGIDHFLFAAGDYMDNSSFTAPSPNYGTIEVVYDLDFTNYVHVFVPAAKTQIGMAHRNRLFLGCGNVPTWTGETAKGNFSASKSLAWMNGTALTAGAVGGLSIQTGVNTISTANGSNAVIGKIYAIRIYNRALTEAEMLNNYNLDLTRYNLS